MTLKSLSPTVAAGAPAVTGAGAVTLVTDVQVGDGPLVTGAVRAQLQPAEAGVDRPTAVHVLTHGPAAVLRHLHVPVAVQLHTCTCLNAPSAAPSHVRVRVAVLQHVAYSHIHQRLSWNTADNLFKR